MQSITSSRQASLHIDNNAAANAKNDVSIQVEISPSHNEKVSAKGLLEDKVSISAEAAKKLLEESKAENIDATENSKPASIMELAEEIKQKTIEDLKERIKELAEELQNLKAQEDESSKEQAKLLQAQINSLNAQLLTILSNKVT